MKSFLGQFHAIYGIVLVVLVVAALMLEVARAKGKLERNPLRGPVIGLYDLEVVLGLFTLLFHSLHGYHTIHPVIMIVGALVLHGMTRNQMKQNVRTSGYALALVLMLVGVAVNLG